jgi:hypothetical protein
LALGNYQEKTEALFAPRPPADIIEVQPDAQRMVPCEA